jgi:methionine-rich copper-binding protein CopC
MNQSRPALHIQHLFTLCLMTTVAVALASAPRIAFAHAVLLQSTPAVNSIVQGPAVSMVFKFNSRVDASKSQISVADQSGQSKRLELDKQESLDTLTTHAYQLSPGKYAIHWQVLSVDGHITRGEVLFEVK